MIEQALINNLAFYRKRACLSQEQLAAAIGVSRKTISTVETGRFAPSVIIALQLATYFDTTVENIFKLEN